MSLPIGKSAVVAWTAALVLAVVVCLALFGRRSEPRKETHDTPPATVPATGPASKPAKPPEPKYVATYMDLIHSEFPAFPVTQSLAVPLDLSEAARLVIRDPLYLDVQDMLLWITRPDAPPTDVVLKKPPDDPERVVITRERVLYVHWLPDREGVWWPFLIVPAAAPDSGGDRSGDTSSAGEATSNAGGGYELLSHFGRQKIGSRGDYRWDRAISWNEALVVPTATGASAFRFALDEDRRPIFGPSGPTPIEEYQDLIDPAANPAATRPSEMTASAVGFAEPQLLLDWHGLLAFIPWDPGKQGGHGAARFINDKWEKLGPATGWPEYVLHLIPLGDRSSVMQLVLTKPGEDDSDDKSGSPAASSAAASAGSDPHTWPVKLGVVDLEHAAIDAKQIRLLVAKLGHEDEAVRDAAFSDLSGYGPAIWPLLKELYDDAAPEAQVRMKQLLRNQVTPLLGGMSLLGGDIRLVCRGRDGSAIFYSEKGVETAGADGSPVVTAPAWIAVRPGHSVGLLPPLLVADLKPDRAQITAVGDDWVVTSDVRGPRRFIGNGFVKLLKKDESGFSDLIGEESRGRWLFRKPQARGSESSSTAAPVAAVDGAVATPVAPANEGPATTPPSQPALQSSTTQAIATARPSGQPDYLVETLIIDPTLPNLVPRLPVWNYTTAEEVGWEKDNWPAVRQLNNYSRLTEADWSVLTPDNPLLTQPEQAPALPGPPATRPAGDQPPITTTQSALAAFELPLKARSGGAVPALTVPQSSAAEPEASTSAATQTAIAATGVSMPPVSPPSPPSTLPATAPEVAATTEPAERPLWVDHDGTRYYNGIDELRVVSPAGRVTSWTLPAVATGKEPVHLVKTGDGRIYLFNEPGRVLRLKPTPDGPEPFVIEATFTRNIPNTDHPTRIWLDPAGRIIIAYDKCLAILFPAGYVPPAIRLKMSNADNQDSDMEQK